MFSPSAATGATGLLARRLGFRPTSVQLPDPGKSVLVELEEIAIPLPTIVSDVVASTCPNKEDPSARAIWDTVRRRYFPLPYRYGMAYAVEIDSSLVKPNDIGKIDESRQFEYGQSIGAGQRLADSARIDALGYAFEYKVSAIRPTMFHKVDRRWRYPKLQSYMAQHFLDRLFGERHLLSIVRNVGGETIIGFCPRRPVPNISGTMVVRSDMTLASVTWRFQTDAPNDDAGGEVIFVPPPRWVRMPLLLPAESTAWERTQGEFREYFRQEVAHYRRWNAQDTMNPVRVGSAAPDSRR
jgi:hypothetical protein